MNMEKRSVWCNWFVEHGNPYVSKAVSQGSSVQHVAMQPDLAWVEQVGCLPTGTPEAPLEKHLQNCVRHLDKILPVFTKQEKIRCQWACVMLISA